MITKYQAGITIGFTLAAFLGSQMIGDRLSSAASRLFADTAPELGSRQSAGSDRSEDLLNSDGTMSGVTLRRTRAYDTQGLQEPKSVLWKTPKLFTLDPGPTFADRHVTTSHRALSIITTNKEAYFSYDLLYVIDLQTGKTKNRFQLHRDYSFAPVLAGDLLFLGGRINGGFYAFDRRDWKEKWQISKSGHSFSSGYSAVAYGMIYFGGQVYSDRQKIRENGNVYAVDANTGKQKWRFSIEGSPTPIAVADEVIYFGDDARHLFAVNAKDGKEIWKFKASEDIGTPAIMDGRAFFSDREGNLYAVDLKNGQAIWKTAKKNKVATTLVAYNKMVYYGGRENSLYAVDALTGEEKWVYRTTKPCPAPVAANGAIYVACQDSRLLAIDGESGQSKWEYQTPHSSISHPVVGNGVIYYMDEEGVMYALGSS
jgi:outer membrane protein assembly factor BamB